MSTETWKGQERGGIAGNSMGKDEILQISKASTPTVSVVENKRQPQGGFWAVPTVAVWKMYKLIGAG